MLDTCYEYILFVLKQELFQEFSMQDWVHLSISWCFWKWDSFCKKRQPLEGILHKCYLVWCQIRKFEIYLCKIPLNELIVVFRPANCSFIWKELLQKFFEISSNIFYTLCYTLCYFTLYVILLIGIIWTKQYVAS